MDIYLLLYTAKRGDDMAMILTAQWLLIWRKKKKKMFFFFFSFLAKRFYWLWEKRVGLPSSLAATTLDTVFHFVYSSFSCVCVCVSIYQVGSSRHSSTSSIFFYDYATIHGRYRAAATPENNHINFRLTLWLDDSYVSGNKIFDQIVSLYIHSRDL